MILQLKDISKTFKQGNELVPVLKNVNLELEKGDSLAITGPSGCGKTTLLSMIAGLDRPDSGQILFNDKDITQYNEDQWTEHRAQNISIIFQQFHLMKQLTALENVMLPLEINNNANLDAAKEALKKVQLSHRLHHQPGQLSGGEQQRVAIARALVTNPTLLLADEPSGNLDQETGLSVMDMLFEIIDQNKMTFVMVTHDMEVKNRCQLHFDLQKKVLS